MTTLYIFSGLPGAGKSTLAVGLSKHIKASYLRVDTIEQSLKELYQQDVYAHGYHLAYRLASDNLRQGLNVVADSCNSVLQSREEWQQVALEENAAFINIEVCCSALNEHKFRVENREPSVEGLILPSWKNVTNRLFEPWHSYVITLDTAGESAQQSIARLIKLLGL
ncbi:MAG: AAA family ATPase [Thalassotalea sp.]